MQLKQYKNNINNLIFKIKSDIIKNNRPLGALYIFFQSIEFGEENIMQIKGWEIVALALVVIAISLVVFVCTEGITMLLSSLDFTKNYTPDSNIFIILKVWIIILCIGAIVFYGTMMLTRFIDKYVRKR